MRHSRKRRIGSVFCLPLAWAVALGASLVLFSCAGRELRKPEVSLAGIQVLEIKALETAFQVDIRVFNPNDYGFEARGLECTLDLNGKRFATGVSKVQTEIPAFGSVTVPVVVYSSVVDIIRGFQGISERNRLDYRIEGRIHLAAGGIGFPSAIPFSSQGEVSIQGLGKF